MVFVANCHFLAKFSSEQDLRGTFINSNIKVYNSLTVLPCEHCGAGNLPILLDLAVKMGNGHIFAEKQVEISHILRKPVRTIFTLEVLADFSRPSAQLIVP
jgi:hypothetical protein